jgi:hypothetical protein
MHILSKCIFIPSLSFGEKKLVLSSLFLKNHVFSHQKLKEAPTTNVNQTLQAIEFSLKESLRELWDGKLGAKGLWLYSYWVIRLYHLLGYIDYIGYMTYG